MTNPPKNCKDMNQHPPSQLIIHEPLSQGEARPHELLLERLPKNTESISIKCYQNDSKFLVDRG